MSLEGTNALITAFLAGPESGYIHGATRHDDGGAVAALA